MKELFKGLMEMEDIKGIFLFSMDGKLVFQDTKEPLLRPIEEEKWLSALNVAKDLDEIEFVYDYEKIYIICICSVLISNSTFWTSRILCGHDKSRGSKES